MDSIPRTFVLLASAAAMATPLAAPAQDSQNHTQREIETRRDPLARRGFTLFGGLSAGYGSARGEGISGGLGGGQYLLGGTLSYQYKRFVLDAGAGWMYSRLNGTTADSMDAEVRTRSGIAELNPRYRITDRWQLGPVANLMFGTDLGFGPSVSQATSPVFAGLKAVYEFPVGRFPMRATAQLSTDLAISGRQMVLGLVGLQFGLPIGGAGNADSAPVPVQTRQASVERDSPAPREVRVTLDPGKVFFGTNSAEIRPEVRDILKAIGHYLGENEKAWDELEITGHADRRGRFEYNQKLSDRRAKSVREVLVQSGVDSEQVQAEGFSYLKPLDPQNNRSAWARNRRVELYFHRVEDPAELMKRLRPLLKLNPEERT